MAGSVSWNGCASLNLNAADRASPVSRWSRKCMSFGEAESLSWIIDKDSLIQTGQCT